MASKWLCPSAKKKKVGTKSVGVNVFCPLTCFLREKRKLRLRGWGSSHAAGAFCGILALRDRVPAYFAPLALEVRARESQDQDDRTAAS